MYSLDTIEPKLLWKHFYDICSIPHPSKHEEAICTHLIAFTEQHNLAYKQDKIGNIVIYKPATKGYENRETLILQAHVDMVPQKNNDFTHNFITDPIIPRIVGNTVKATHTTLGADNGIGLAAILAVLEDSTLEHGPLEALCTIDEETGMTGAKHLDPTFLQGKYMLNTDSEIENEITIGCAGGVDGNFIFPITRNTPQANSEWLTITIKGLNGGHSGFEIHLGRANANKCIIDILQYAIQAFKAEINKIEGGNMRNAIPREAHATLCVPKQYKNEFITYIENTTMYLQSLYSKTDANLTIEISPCTAEESIIEPQTMHRVLQAINQCPQGVIEFINNTVQTSTNLSIIECNANEITVKCLLRSSVDTRRKVLQESMGSLFALYGAQTEFVGEYPAWTPIWNSTLLETTKQALANIYKTPAKVEVVHAGLECGIIGNIYTNMKFVSFGPYIRNPHSPDEEVEIESVSRFYSAICELLQLIPNK